MRKRASQWIETKRQLLIRGDEDENEWVDNGRDDIREADEEVDRDGDFREEYSGDKSLDGVIAQRMA